MPLTLVTPAHTAAGRPGAARSGRRRGAWRRPSAAARGSRRCDSLPARELALPAEAVLAAAQDEPLAHGRTGARRHAQAEVHVGPRPRRLAAAEVVRPQLHADLL